MVIIHPHKNISRDDRKHPPNRFTPAHHGARQAHPGNQQRGDSNLPTPCLSRGVHLTTRSLPIKRLQKAAEKKQRALPVCACVRAHRKKEVVRAAIGDMRARKREKKKRRPVVHTVFTHMHMYVRAYVCLCIVMCACVEACHERDIFSRSHSTRERRISIVEACCPATGSCRALTILREREKERERERERMRI